MDTWLLSPVGTKRPRDIMEGSSPAAPPAESESLAPYYIDKLVCVELAKSGRSTCSGCRKLIDKSVPRIGFRRRFSSQDSWLHLNCARLGAGRVQAPENLERFYELPPHNQAAVRAHFAASAHAASSSTDSSLLHNSALPTLVIPVNADENGPSRVRRDVGLGDIFVGNFRHGEDCEILAQFGIKFILNLAPERTSRDQWRQLPGLIYHLVSILDDRDQDLLQHLEAATAFIRRARERGEHVLVHCMAGMNRAPSVVAAYLIKYHGVPLVQALERLKQARRVVKAETFTDDLEEWERLCSQSLLGIAGGGGSGGSGGDEAGGGIDDGEGGYGDDQQSQWQQWPEEGEDEDELELPELTGGEGGGEGGVVAQEGGDNASCQHVCCDVVDLSGPEVVDLT